MKKILVPTDFSEVAGYATEVAAEIAKKNNGRLFLLHIVDLPQYSESLPIHGNYQDIAESIGILKLVKKKFKELLSKPYMKDVNVVEVLQFENVFNRISEEAKKNEIDLIVMGSHGVSGIKEFIVGSNTQRVIRFSECPVLTIKNKINKISFKEMVFASNFYGETKDSFWPIKAFADLFNSRIHLLRINTRSDFETSGLSLRFMKEFAENYGLTNYTCTIFNDETLEEGILNFSNSINADLISMETHGTTGFEQVINPSLTEGVANHVDKPLLSIKIKEKEVKYKPLFPSV